MTQIKLSSFKEYILLPMCFFSLYSSIAKMLDFLWEDESFYIGAFLFLLYLSCEIWSITLKVREEKEHTMRGEN